MIMSLKQKKFKFKPRIKLNHNVAVVPWTSRAVLTYAVLKNSFFSECANF